MQGVGAYGVDVIKRSDVILNQVCLLFTGDVLIIVKQLIAIDDALVHVQRAHGRG